MWESSTRCTQISYFSYLRSPAAILLNCDIKTSPVVPFSKENGIILLTSTIVNSYIRQISLWYHQALYSFYIHNSYGISNLLKDTGDGMHVYASTWFSFSHLICVVFLICIVYMNNFSWTHKNTNGIFDGSGVDITQKVYVSISDLRIHGSFCAVNIIMIRGCDPTTWAAVVKNELQSWQVDSRIISNERS